MLNLVINADEANSLEDDKGFIRIGTKSLTISSEIMDAINSDFYLISDDFSEGEYIEISVEDNGTGIDENKLTLIFDPFYPTKFTGRGLGLPSVLGVINQHKGAIRIVAEKNGGSTFYLYIPVTLQ